MTRLFEVAESGNRDSEKSNFQITAPCSSRCFGGGFQFFIPLSHPAFNRLQLKAPREVLDLKLREAQELSEQVALAKIELGKRISELPKATPNNNKFHEIESPVDLVKPKSEAVAELGLTQKQAERLQQMAKNPDAVHSAMPKAHAGGWSEKVNLEIRPASKSEIDESEIEENDEEPP